MMRALLRVASCLALGGLTLAGLYWLFLHTPESNALTLAGSVALVLMMITAAAVTVNAAVLLARGDAWGPSLRRALRGIPWVVVAAIPAVIAWIGVTRVDAWIERHSGEISAWFIAQFGWADVTPLFTVELWLSRWIRWVVVPVAALCLLDALLHAGVRALTGARWIRHAWHWRTLALASVVVFVLLALPWQLAMWRPKLPATWVELPVAGLRLGVVAMLWLIGGAVLVALAARLTSLRQGYGGPPELQRRRKLGPTTDQ